MTETPRSRLAGLARQGGQRFWRGFDELVDDPAARQWIEAEFPSAFAAGVGRRDVLKVMAASLVMASLGGCGQGEESTAVPYVQQPAIYVPGVPRRFATAVPFDGYGEPVLAECHAGRPTRLDGNPQHPMSEGAISAFAQAAVLELYDPDRSGTVTHRGRITTWGVFEQTLITELSKLAPSHGEGLYLLSGPIGSPTLLRQVDALRRRWPALRWHSYSAVPDLRPEATRKAFGQSLSVWPRLDQAEIVVSLEDDLLGPGPAQTAMARAWSAQRLKGEGMPLLFVAESTPSLTGAMAHRRLTTASARIPLLAAGLAGRREGLTPPESAWVSAVLRAVTAHPNSVVVSAGSHQPADTQALCMALGYRLGSPGETVAYTDPVVTQAEFGLSQLVADMQAGKVKVLLMLDVNPVYGSPGELDYAVALARVPLSVHAGGTYDETASLSQWHLPLAHPLESWSDIRAVDGSVTIMQPLVGPLRQGRTAHQILSSFLGQPGVDAYSPVRETWQQQLDEPAWRSALEEGVVPGTGFEPLPVEAKQLDLAPPPAPAAGTEVVFRADPTVWDGRFANCAWLQELPKPLTKAVWDNVVAISPAMAARLHVDTGGVVEVEVKGRQVRGPAWVMPGQAHDTVTLFLGYGRRRVGRVGEDRGYNAFPLFPADAAPSYAGDLRAVGQRYGLVTTQEHHAIDGTDLVRVVHPGEGVELAAETVVGHPDRPTLYPRYHYDGVAWGMVIDIDLCIGCNACVVACQAENNIPTVGKDQVAVGREMHWLRIDRYYEGSADHPFTHFQPVPCMHCENAPCELGCPVNATVHGPDGVNEMVYNRCIGTRTCATFCPYKVRRFNYFDFARDAPALQWSQRNPDVTVRGRGVMEKCTYCAQRIAAARIAADKEQRPIRDGEVQTACQAACPTDAIIFGNLADPGSETAMRRTDRRNYGLLDELNTWPRTTYLARVRRYGAQES